MHTAGLRIVKEEIARGDYHSLRLFCVWVVGIMGALTYLSIKHMDYTGNVISATIADLRDGVVRGHVVTSCVAAISLLLWVILLKKSKNLLEEIEDNCIMSIFLGVVSAIVLGVCTYAIYSTPKYSGSKSLILFLDFLGTSSLILGIIGLVIVKFHRRKKKW